MSGMCWLHLSDWHQSDTPFERRKVRDALLHDISERGRINEALEKIDFIVFSGDLAAHGKYSEYKAAEANFLDPVLKASGVGKEQLFVVPGNHDLDQDAFELDPKNLLKKMNDPETVTDWLGSPLKRAALLQPFSDYCRFVREYLGGYQDFISACPAYGYVRNLKVSHKTVSIICLNSAWLCGRHKHKSGDAHDRGHLLIGEPQIHDTIDTARSSDLRIAVCHHPVDWLTEEESIRTGERMSSECSYVLVGHQHYPQVRIEFSSAIGNVIVMPGGASYDRPPQKGYHYPHTYLFNYLDLDSGQGTVHIRRWSERRNQWITDTESPQEGRVDYTLASLAPINLHVSVAIVIKDHQVLLVKRRKKENTLQWQFPGGVIAAGQTDKEAAVREAFGETSIRVRPRRKIGQRVHPDTRVMVHYWICDYVSGKVAVKDIKDLVEARWAPAKEAFKLITSDIYPEVKNLMLKAS